MGARWQGTRMNVALITSYLSPQAKTALDVGSNEGVITCAMSLSDIAARGVEMNSKYVSRARRLASHLSCTAEFEHKALTLEDIKSLAPVDVITFLSVHHQIAAGYGIDVADEYVRALSRKSSVQFIFQPACIAEKYGNNTLPFADNNIYEIVEYFSGLVGSEMPYLEVVGLAQNDLPKHEPVRPLMIFSREPIKLRKSCHTALILGQIEQSMAKGSLAHYLGYSLAGIFNRGRRPAD